MKVTQATKLRRFGSAIRGKGEIIGVAVSLCGGCESGLTEPEEEADGSQVGSAGLTTTLGDSGGPTTTTVTTTNSVTSGTTTGVADDTGGTTTDDVLDCPERESEQQTNVRVKFEAWSPQIKEWQDNGSGGEGLELHYDGICIYRTQQMTRTGDIARYFICDIGEDSRAQSDSHFADETSGLWITTKGSVTDQWKLSEDDGRRVAIQWTSQAHHREESTSVVAFEPQSVVPEFVASTGQSVHGLIHAIRPMELELSDSECAPIDGEALWGQSYRQRLILRHDGEKIASLLDASFGSFVVDAQVFDYRVDTALRHECLNCWHSFDFSWVARK